MLNVATNIGSGYVLRHRRNPRGSTMNNKKKKVINLCTLSRVQVNLYVFAFERSKFDYHFRDGNRHTVEVYIEYVN